MKAGMLRFSPWASRREGDHPSGGRLRAASATVLAALACAALAAADDRENCLYCHRFPGLSRLDSETRQVRLFYVDPSYTIAHKGPHSRLACTDCHQASEVGVVPHKTLTPVDCTRQCHLVSTNAPERRFSHENIARMLERSVHKLETLRDLKFSGGPLLNAGQSLCLSCHDEPVFRVSGLLTESVLARGSRAMDRCDTCHATQVPLNTAYFARHVTARFEDARPTLEVAQVCAVCHSDPKIREDHGLKDAVASYVRSFHGKAALLGDESTAGCVSCHVKAGENAHLMLGPKEAGSSVNFQNIANSCRSLVCHPGADKAIANAAVHLDLPTARDTLERGLAIAFIILTLVSFGPSASIVVLELLQLVVGRRHPAHHEMETLVGRVLDHPRGRATLRRFSFKYSVQHWILVVLFATLALTGFPLKFASQPWASWMIHNVIGGLGTARFIHHWAGVALVAGFIVHITDALVGVFRRSRELRRAGKPKNLISLILELPMLVSPSDLVKANQLMMYLVGLRRERPTFGRFTAPEKFEYFGVAWGTSLLGVTGLMLWGVQTTSQWITGRAFNIATIMHTYEAYLAVIHVGILHICNVVLAPTVFPLSLATLTGVTPAAKLAEEHGEFVAEAAEKLGLPLEVGPHD